MRNRIKFYILILVSLFFCSCATFKNVKDTQISYKESAIIGSVSKSSIAWSWTNFSKRGNSKFNNNLYDKLYNKAVEKYGTDIDLCNIVIQDSVLPNIGIHSGATVLLGVYSSRILEDENKLYNNNIDATDLFLWGSGFSLSLMKIVKITADVVKRDISSPSVSNLFVNEEVYNLKKQGLLSDKEVIAISNGQIFIGMSEKALKLSWGTPKRINSYNYGNGTEYQYCYENTYVYVKYGSITAWN